MLQKFDDRFRYRSLQLRYKDKSKFQPFPNGWQFCCELSAHLSYSVVLRFIDRLPHCVVSFQILGASELRQNIRRIETQVQYTMSQLARQVKRRDKHRHRRERQYNLITAILQASSPKRSK